MKLQHFGMAALLAAAAVPAAAAQFDFYKLGRGAGDFLPSDGIACTGGDLCSSNADGGVLNGDLTFSTGGITAHATAFFTDGASAVVQDHESGWTATKGAGLGVYHTTHPVDTSDDNITRGETLTLTFDQVVHLTAIGLRSDGHNFTNWSTGATFLFDGISTALPSDDGLIDGLNKTGSVFTFAYGGTHADQFYLSGVTVNAVPEPETYALMIAGLGVMGFLSRRRKQSI